MRRSQDWVEARAVVMRQEVHQNPHFPLSFIEDNRPSALYCISKAQVPRSRTGPKVPWVLLTGEERYGIQE